MNNKEVSRNAPTNPRPTRAVCTQTVPCVGMCCVEADFVITRVNTACYHQQSTGVLFVSEFRFIVEYFFSVATENKC